MEGIGLLDALTVGDAEDGMEDDVVDAVTDLEAL